MGDEVTIQHLSDRLEVPPERMTGRARAYLTIAAIRHLVVAVTTWTMTERFTSASFTQIRAIMPMWAWGFVFLGAGIACGLAALVGQETLARVGLILSATSSALWA